MPSYLGMDTVCSWGPAGLEPVPVGLPLPRCACLSSLPPADHIGSGGIAGWGRLASSVPSLTSQPRRGDGVGSSHLHFELEHRVRKHMGSSGQSAWTVGAFLLSVRTLFRRCSVREQFFSALLGSLGQKLVTLRNEQHMPAGVRVAHCAGSLYRFL